MTEITITEWRAEFERVTAARNDEGLTVSEVAEALGIPHNRAQAFIRNGVKSGEFVLGRRTIDKDWDGRMRCYKVFRPKR